MNDSPLDIDANHEVVAPPPASGALIPALVTMVSGTTAANTGHSTPGAEALQNESFLHNVRNRIADVVGCASSPSARSDSILRRAAGHLCLNHSDKSARPRLVSLVGSAFGVAESDLVDIAVAVELIHSASLLHDDVIDEGKERRGRPTVNVLWGNTVAVLSGDYLLSVALTQLTPHGSALVSRAVETVAEMARSMIIEAEISGNIDATLEEWRFVAEGKTASLFAFCCAAVGLLARRDNAVEALDRCGRHLGVAFQLGDDLKDILQNDPSKTLLADLREQRASYPLLIAASRSPAVAAAVRAAWNNPEADERAMKSVADAVLATGAAEACLTAVREELEQAKLCLARVDAPLTPALLQAWIDLMLSKVVQDLV